MGCCYLTPGFDKQGVSRIAGSLLVAPAGSKSTASPSNHSEFAFT